MTNATLDIGNSRVKLARFSGGRLEDLHTFAVEPATWTTLVETLTNHPVQNFIYSTVGATAPPARLLQLRRLVPGLVLELTETTPLPFQNDYTSPATLGKDRLAALAGALAHYPGQACLVVDAGTCVTMDLLTADGRFIGGNISPGLQMRLRAMHEGTARLPLVEASGTLPDLLGTSTEGALRSGSIFGLQLEIEGLYARLRQKFGPLTLVLTGGDAPLLASLPETELFTLPNLVLDGLNEILNYNHEHHFA